MSGIAGLIDGTTSAPAKGHSTGVRARPFVKWAGGKRSLIPDLLQHLPETIGTYYEPFVGGGAMFYAIERGLSHACLSDANAELMLAYRMIQQECEAVIVKLQYHEKLHGKRHYIGVRKRHKIECPIERAARFIYLNKTCFNGLYRVNSAGEFNVPMGSYKSPAIVDADNLRAVAVVLEKAVLKWNGFDAIEPQAGDLVYCDPPYDETYDQYTADRFNGTGQQRLADTASQWHKSGVSVIISSSDTPLVRNLYKAKHWNIRNVQAANNINCKAEGRGKRQEVIITNA